MNKINKYSNAPNYFAFIKIFAVGLLCTESVFFALEIAPKFFEYITKNKYEVLSLIISFIYFLTIVIYLLFRKAHLDFVKLINSRRLDVLTLFISGVIADIFLGGIGVNVYQHILALTNINQLFVLFTLPLVMITSIFIRRVNLWVIYKQKRREEPFFMSDIEKQEKKDDLLGFSEIAEPPYLCEGRVVLSLGDQFIKNPARSGTFL